MEDEGIFENLQIKIEDIPSIDDLSFNKLDKGYLSLSILSTILFYSLLLIGLLIWWFLDDKNTIRPIFQWVLLGFLVLFIFSLFITYKSFQFQAFAFRQKDITYKSGWLWRKMTTVPFNRVQHCEVSQGLLDRYYGLSKLKIFTAGGSSSDISIPGLTKDQADELKQFILEKVKIDE